MADVFDAATRSRVMRAIKSRDTKPELALGAALAREGVQASKDNRLPGRPDFIVLHCKLAVFSHGCFWHCCPRHYKEPSGEGWRAKMAANRQRDVRVRRQLRALGWRTVVVWEHDDVDRAARRIARLCDRLGRRW